MAYIESGPMNSDFLKNLSSQVNSTYGNDTASTVLTYKEAFGLNYQGAIRMFNLMDELSKTESSLSLTRPLESKRFFSSSRLEDAFLKSHNSRNL
jgi:hypothetical protein